MPFWAKIWARDNRGSSSNQFSKTVSFSRRCQLVIVGAGQIFKWSSNTNEGIRAVLFFKQKDFTRTKSTKSTKAHISEQKQKSQRFYALKKRLRGRKLLVHLHAFLCFLCAFCPFCGILCVKQKRQHFYAHKKHLRGRKLLVWCFVLFVLFVLFMLFMCIKKI